MGVIPNNLEPFLSAEQVATYHRDGYLIVPDFFDERTRKALVDRAKHLLATFSLDDHPMTAFTTGGEDGSAHVGDQYFLTSGDQTRFFFEEGALEADGKSFKAGVTKETSVNKIGHGLHEHDPVFGPFSLSDRVRRVVADLGVHSDPRVLQSMAIFKQPRVGGAVPVHNDSTFLYTDPPSAVGLWFALEDCTPTNGCLYFLPGSQDRPVHTRFVRLPSGGTGFITVPGLEAAQAAEEAEGWDESAFKCEPCKAGTLVIIGRVVHKSERNLSDKSRYAYTFHVIEGDESKAIYDEQNWLQLPGRRPFTPLFP